MPAEVLTYDFYTTVYHGELDSDAFTRSLAPATARLIALTGNEVPERVREAWLLALCALCDRVSGSDQRGYIKSETVGATSVTYSDACVNMTDYDAVRPYLAHTGLLWRGVVCTHDDM